MIKLLEEKPTKEKRLPTIERLSPEMRVKVERIGQMEYECYIKYQEYINNKNINNNSHNNNKICEETEQYKPKINHPHDKAMRAILSNKKEAANIINISLGLDGTRRVKPNEIVEYKTDFVTKDYFNREIDIIYKDLTQKNLFYIIEHQTKIDYQMQIRLIEYYTEVMRNTYTNKEKGKKYKIPTIIPIILYGGNKKWNAKNYMDKSQIPGREIVPMNIGEYVVLDANDYTIEKLKNTPGATLRLLLLEKSKTIQEATNKVEEIAKEQLEPETKSAIIQYINFFIEGKYGEEVARSMIEKLNINYKEEKSMLSDVLDQIEERGRKEGIKEGRTEGLQESKRKMIKVAKNLLKKGLSKAEVAEITELNIKEINEIAN